MSSEIYAQEGLSVRRFDCRLVGPSVHSERQILGEAKEKIENLKNSPSGLCFATEMALLSLLAVSKAIPARISFPMEL